MTEPLSKVDSAVEGLGASPPKDAAKSLSKHRQSTAAASGVYRIEDLAAEEKDIKIAIETQKTGWKVNKSPNTVEEKEILKIMLTDPPIKKIDLHFPLGLEVTARNLKGVTIKDALDAIHKQFKKRQDDELEEPYLAGFEYDPEESRTRLVVHLTKNAGVAPSQGKKKKNKKEGE